MASLLPFTDPAHLQGIPSPYFNETHYALQKEVREFTNQYIVPFVDEWDAKGEIDPQLYQEFCRRGYLCAIAGQQKYPTEYTDIRIKSVPPNKYDFFHEMIIVDEISRCGSGGVIWYLVGGINISLPAIFKYAAPEVKRRVIPQILSGSKRSCLCITEPDAGSDVANLTTEAQKVDGGFILSGTKKWITNGIFSDYFVVACRTGGSGSGGVSLLLADLSIDKDAVSRRKISTQGMRGSGTTLINFDELFVPDQNVLGTVNQGFRAVMSNFNHERLIIIVQALRLCRVVYEDCMQWTHQRETFGTKLINHAVIRQKLGVMAGRIEALQSWVNELGYQTKILSEEQATLELSGRIAAAKGFATQALELCAREGSQIFGGLSYTQGGRGARVERIYREVRAFAIPGGSEEIMMDLAVRQSIKSARKRGAKL